MKLFSLPSLGLFVWLVTAPAPGLAAPPEDRQDTPAPGESNDAAPGAAPDAPAPPDASSESAAPERTAVPESTALETAEPEDAASGDQEFGTTPGDPAPGRDPSTSPPPPPLSGGQLGITVGVPFFDESILNGDVTVDVRYGRKFWWLVPYVSVGFRQTRLDPALVPDIARRKKLEAWHVTAGLRLEIPASEKLFPFVGIAGELNRWGFTASTLEFCQEDFYPEAWRCYERYQWKNGWAVKPQVGLIYKPEPSLALEFWVERGVVDAPGMFTRQVTFIHPALGFAWHH
jgi:hypothetical protein